MCGICGIVSFKNVKPISNENLRKMSNVMFHRGPDDSGTFLNKEKSPAIIEIKLEASLNNSNRQQLKMYLLSIKKSPRSVLKKLKGEF